MSNDTYTALRKKDHERAAKSDLIILAVFEPDADGRDQWLVQSQSEPDVGHLVRVDWAPGGPKVTCDAYCPGFNGIPGVTEPRHTCLHTAKVERRLIETGQMNDPFVAPVSAVAERDRLIERIKGARSLALINGDDEDYDRLNAQLQTMGAV